MCKQVEIAKLCGVLIQVPELVSAGGEQVFARANGLDLTSEQFRSDLNASRRAALFAKLKPDLVKAERADMAKNLRLEV